MKWALTAIHRIHYTACS